MKEKDAYLHRVSLLYLQKESPKLESNNWFSQHLQNWVKLDNPWMFAAFFK